MIGRKGLLVLIVAGGMLGTVRAAAAQETTLASGSPAATADAQDPQAKPAPPNPEPEHTGLAAIVYKTGADFKAFPRRKSTWVILGIGGAAAAAVSLVIAVPTLRLRAAPYVAIATLG